jgi:hypothetical protein
MLIPVLNNVPSGEREVNDPARTRVRKYHRSASKPPRAMRAAGLSPRATHEETKHKRKHHQDTGQKKDELDRRIALHFRED